MATIINFKSLAYEKIGDFLISANEYWWDSGEKTYSVYEYDTQFHYGKAETEATYETVMHVFKEVCDSYKTVKMPKDKE